MIICDHGKTVVNSVGEIVKDCEVCYAKVVKDYERLNQPQRPEPKPKPQPVPNLFA